MLGGTIPDATYKEAEEDFRAEIAATEKALRDRDARHLTQDAFLRFAKLHLADIAGAWQLATAQQKHRVQNLLFEDGLFYSEETGILNRSKSCLFSVVERFGGEKASLASPTGFGPVFTLRKESNLQAAEPATGSEEFVLEARQSDRIFYRKALSVARPLFLHTLLHPKHSRQQTMEVQKMLVAHVAKLLIDVLRGQVVVGCRQGQTLSAGAASERFRMA